MPEPRNFILSCAKRRLFIIFSRNFSARSYSGPLPRITMSIPFASHPFSVQGQGFLLVPCKEANNSVQPVLKGGRGSRSTSVRSTVFPSDMLTYPRHGERRWRYALPVSPCKGYWQFFEMLHPLIILIPRRRKRGGTA